MPVEVAALLGHDKSWGCRRLAMLEKLCDEANEQLKLGLLGLATARQLTQLPAGNQPEVLAAMHRDGFAADELRGVVDLVAVAKSRSRIEHILDRPRQAVTQARSQHVQATGPRLSGSANN